MCTTCDLFVELFNEREQRFKAEREKESLKHELEIEKLKTPKNDAIAAEKETYVFIAMAIYLVYNSVTNF